jgi:antitoxin CcdA
MATNLSARADLVSRAKELQLNLSDLFERALAKAIADRERELWLEENRDAIEDYNARVAERGVFSDDWRRF